VSELLVLVPMRVEALALGSRPGWTVIRSGMGPARARIAAARGLAVEAPAVVVVGVCAAAAGELRAGDVVVASELHAQGARPAGLDPAPLVEALHRRGLSPHAGPIHSTDRLTPPEERDRLAVAGAIAVDMESAWLAEAAAGRSLGVVRVVVEPAGRRLADPRTLVAGPRALATLRRMRDALDDWAAAVAALDLPRAAPDKVRM
jgi:4-hydroxy-3-methylbut-2-enyl diphosphate reductase